MGQLTYTANRKKRIREIADVSATSVAVQRSGPSWMSARAVHAGTMFDRLRRGELSIVLVRSKIERGDFSPKLMHCRGSQARKGASYF
jgi:hypothetical protein